MPEVPVEVPEHDNLVGSGELFLDPLLEGSHLLLEDPAVAVLIIRQVSAVLER